MAIKLTNARDAAALHGVKTLVYGRAGMGKTYLARTAPSPVVISAESGLLSLRDTAIPVIVIKTVADLQDAYKWATESSEAAGFETLYLDSISEIAEVVLASEKAINKDPRAAYGNLIDMMLITIKSFRDISGKHVVMTAKQGSNTDQVSGTITYGPSLPGARLANEIPYLFDLVMQIGVGKTPDAVEYRYLRTHPDIQSEAKDRSGVLDTLEPPDLTHVFNKILNTSKAA
jgi:hypothetical protein